MEHLGRFSRIWKKIDKDFLKHYFVKEKKYYNEYGL